MQIRAALALSLSLLLGLPAAAGAHPGALDTTFGAGTGEVTQHVGAFVDGAVAVAATSDGGLIVAGRAAQTAPSTTSDLGLVALDASGTPRSGFGTAGHVEIPIAPPNSASGAIAVAQRPDGSYLVGAVVFNAAIPSLAVDTVSAGGVAAPATITALPAPFTAVSGVAVDGRNGFVYFDGPVGAKTAGIARLNAAGVQDASFGTAGVGSEAINAGTNAAIGRVVLQSDGKPIVVANGVQADNTTHELSAVRFTTGGQPDPTYGTAGVATLPSSPATLQGPAVGQPAVSAAGLAVIGNLAAAAAAETVVRFTPDGHVATSFGGGSGVTQIGNGGLAIPSDLVIGDDGRVIVIGADVVATAGGLGVRGSGYANRLNADGTHDLSFGDNPINGYGPFTSWFNGPTDSYSHAASVLTPAGLVTVGTFRVLAPPTVPPSPNPVPSQFAVARLVTAPDPLDQPPVVSLAVAPGSGSTTKSFSFTATASDPDGSIGRYEWDFDGDGVADRVTSGPTASHIYPTKGTFTARVTAFDNAGASTAATVAVKVTSAAEDARTALRKVRGKLTLAKKTVHGKRSLADVLSKVSDAACPCQYFAVVRRGTTILAVKQGTLDRKHVKLTFSLRAHRHQKLTESVRLIDTFGNRVDLKLKLTVK